MPRKQKNREIVIASPLGQDVLLFGRMTATEELGRLFKIDLDLLSEDQNIKFDDLLGQRVTVRLQLPEGKFRYFSGHVGRFGQTGRIQDLYCYQATVYPWLWFLTRTATCRIFQDKTIPDIIKEVFRGHGFTDYAESLGSYQTWEYCVQYRETDFNFVSRLMEHEGIYYYFKHENDKHTLVLSDSLSSHQPFPGYGEIPYYPPTALFQRERDHIHTCTFGQEIQPGTCALNDFDFKSPKANLQVKSKIKRKHVVSDMEVYDYPGDYTQTGQGETYARTRIEELQSDFEQLAGEGVARGISVGSLFTLTGHSRDDQNREYLVVSATHHLVSDEYQTSTDTEGETIYSCSFKAVPSSQPFRAARTTPKPVIQGPQTAMVVGPSGSEIHTDKYGRIKVKFHWDRIGKGDDTASCWMRVAQVWAGAKWGSIHIPRIGHEVMVEFLEGDPDRPIITGRVYNNDNMPPYDLPANMTRSGVKSRSSKGGSPTNINELRFEDKKGEEQIFMQAEKNLDVRVKNDHVEWVGNESHLTVKKDQIQKVECDKHLTVKGDHKEKVDGTISITAGIDMQEKVGMKHALEAGQEIHLKGGMNVIIEAGMSITLKAGAGFVVVGPAGVTISGTPVLINSGGAAGAGSGSSPDSPKEPREPEKATPVQDSTPPASGSFSPQAFTFKSAAVTGTPFCETSQSR